MDHETTEQVPEDGPLVGLVGAPNVGKSVIFNALGNETVDVSNYPGTTVETTLADADGFALTDTPGVYGISSFNEEERVTRDILFDLDAVVNVVDATHLDRDLFLTLQLLDMGIPTVVALNMMDEARADGIEVDPETLEAQLGVPVVPTVATEGTGIEDVESRIPEATAPDETAIDAWFEELPADLPATRLEKTLLVEGDEATAERVLGRENEVVADGGTTALVPNDLRDTIYSHRRSRIGDIVDESLYERPGEKSLGDRFDDLLLNPLTGTPIAIAIMGLIYFLIGDLVAQRLVDVIEVELFGEYYVPFVTTVVGDIVPGTGLWEPVQFVLINDNLGLLTVTVQYILGVLLPLVVSFYLALAVLEDSGILPRLAVLTDRGMSRIGLNGRAIIPMIVGVGCVTMAVISTRMMGTKRQRTIATALLGLSIPCSAQLGVILGLLAGLGMGWWLAYLGVILLVFGLAGKVLDSVLPGTGQGLLTELPRLRRPSTNSVLSKTWTRTKMFLREAGPLFAATAIAVSALDYTGSLATIERWLEPLVGIVGLPASFGQVLILGLIRRDFAAAGMTDMALSAPQVFVGLVVVTLFVPCILSMMMIVKERDLKSGVLMWIGSWVVAFTVGGLLALVLL
ncbi:Fe2+ transport system protein B [Halanaeroarchaeum sp. HSR-CO]|uniref:ferrous iron transport protein B n=1 Tax=Halanaeroarchaeum sp. HSR-CO TaxID=2866382 RepID=UPI00217DAD58|nr:ferrous iron transport protein B [Halanaeroarchaeum sp. HSR-CO]UWG47390.1 Fe2+ transport system protein B [Halanaeroarchaeum sp. HSR-CO]